MKTPRKPQSRHLDVEYNKLANQFETKNEAQLATAMKLTLPTLKRDNFDNWKSNVKVNLLMVNQWADITKWKTRSLKTYLTEVTQGLRFEVNWNTLERDKATSDNDNSGYPIRMMATKTCLT